MHDGNTRAEARAWLPIGAALLALLAAPAKSQSGAADAPAERFIGVYTLAEFAGHGDQPTGRISYDGGGRMWAMLLPPGREPITDASTAEEYRAAMRGLVAYYGTYEVDTESGRVVHHVEAASNPAWVGDEFVRWYRFEGEDLRLSLNPEFENTLLWQRLPAE